MRSGPTLSTPKTPAQKREISVTYRYEPLRNGLLAPEYRAPEPTGVRRSVRPVRRTAAARDRRASCSARSAPFVHPRLGVRQSARSGARC